MRLHTTKAMIAIAAVAALGVPAGAQASHGADDPAGHVRHAKHHVKHKAKHHAKHHVRHGHGADDGPNHT